MAKKHIGELLYNDSIEYNKLIAFWKSHQDKYNMCNRGQISKVAKQDYGLGYETAANGIASYIEMLQDKINTLENGTTTRN